MSFKTDYSFLDKLTMGAIGTTKAIEALNDLGHEVIELERYSARNKIWGTKIKRLRVPDLLCIKCGTRFEVRAKSKLGIIMSDSPNVPNRKWDYGLRDEDVAVFIRCNKNPTTNSWEPSNKANMFKIKDLRVAEDFSKLGPPKSQSEGSERDRKWPAYVPGISGTITGVENNRIRIKKKDGKQQGYSLRDGWYCYVEPGDEFAAGENIIASVVPRLYDGLCDKADDYEHHNFISELDSNERETLYAAIKAAGFIKHQDNSIKNKLINIMQSHTDKFIRLEAAGTLIRLGFIEGINHLKRVVNDCSASGELRMEGVLVLSEINTDKSFDVLTSLAHNVNAPLDLRAASLWGTINHSRSNQVVSTLIPFISDPNIDISGHAIIAISRHITSETVKILLDALDEDKEKASAIEYILYNYALDYVPLIIDYLINNSTGGRKKWLMHLAGLIGEDICKPHLLKHGENGEIISESLDLFWNYHNLNWTFQLDIADRLRFLSYQW